jgi:hypothetical protein
MGSHIVYINGTLKSYVENYDVKRLKSYEIKICS